MDGAFNSLPPEVQVNLPQHRSVHHSAERALACHRRRENVQMRSGGEAGIRTLGTGLSPYNGLANRRLQPLGHLTADGKCT